MKNINMLLRLAGLLAFGAIAALAKDAANVRAYIESDNGRTDIPVPVKIVEPRVAAEQAGQTVEVEFVVDTAGEPQNVRLLGATDDDVGLAVCNAVKYWRFAPARPNGEPVAMKVMLPVVIVDSE
ncbi:MAG: hypothetical protein A3G75_04435 [Verrucomicrobia bacterium RIFCSPLOWO2_12_FULL_64_8]|nr:MAG: hypothetical protein A3G75_04435 [Verrucomicrobia bacterium RIFCSPLOWO2_12_FULL_64_8]